MHLTNWYQFFVLFFLCFQAEDGIRYLVRSRGLGDVYKRQIRKLTSDPDAKHLRKARSHSISSFSARAPNLRRSCLLYTSDAADERSSVDLGGRRIIKKKKTEEVDEGRICTIKSQKPE